MSREGDLMRKALKRHVFPGLAALGFTGGPTHFRRLRSDTHDMLSVQYWKYGGSFILEFGRRERGPLHTTWGEVVAEDRLDVAYLAVQSRARLQERPEAAADTFAGFRFEGFGEDVARYDTLAARVSAMLPQVDAWLDGGVVGPDIHAFPPG